MLKTVSSIADVSQGSVIGVLPTANGGTGSAVAAPSFSAHNASDQAVTSGVFTKATLGTEVFDTNSNFAASRFTATVAGYYHFDVTVRAGGDAVVAAEAFLYKNGAAYQKVISTLTSAVGTVFSGSGMIQLAAADYVELYVAITGTNPVIGYGDDINCTWLSGFWIRG